MSSCEVGVLQTILLEGIDKRGAGIRGIRVEDPGDVKEAVQAAFVLDLAKTNLWR
jgi:hypothetical protein